MLAIIFDVDGVLAESSKDHYLAWKKLAAELGFDLPKEYEDRLRGISRAESLEQLLTHGHLEKTFTQKEKQELMDRKNDYYQQALEDVTLEDANPGVKELLEELKGMKIPMAIASASRNAPKLLEKMEIWSYFDYMVDPATIQHPKPDPEIFLKAAEGLGVEPAHCIGIEDAPAGIESILQAGMKPIAIGKEYLFPPGIPSFESLKEASPYLLELIKEDKTWQV